MESPDIWTSWMSQLPLLTIPILIHFSHSRPVLAWTSLECPASNAGEFNLQFLSEIKDSTLQVRCRLTGNDELLMRTSHHETANFFTFTVPQKQQEGYLGTVLIILNRGQMTRMRLHLEPPLQTPAPHGCSSVLLPGLGPIRWAGSGWVLGVAWMAGRLAPPTYDLPCRHARRAAHLPWDGFRA
ncbi:hypothetical protein AVEN_68004-1 [Araneus ventricosus]|uniref:Uncharacterized protein n=1 Tax=Araneus ventricosus TaxID=182803 RepID=A0A4Y2TSU9_ARAVE|nr:hypothetical protein AVEN_68004-1 [Araneus ventricosus]